MLSIGGSFCQECCRARALLVAKAVTVGTGLVGNGPQPRSPNVAVGVRMGLLPEGVQSVVGQTDKSAASPRPIQ